MFPLINHYDFERIEYRICVSKFEIPVSVKIYHRDSGVDEKKSFGSGTFGEVYGWMDQVDNKMYCLKRMIFSHTKEKSSERVEKLKFKRHYYLEENLR